MTKMAIALALAAFAGAAWADAPHGDAARGKALFMAGITYLLVPLVSQAPLLALTAFLLGIGLGCAQPLTIILTYNHAPAGRSGEALGMRLTVNKLTQIAVPLVFGGLGSAFGLIPVFWANGAFLLLGGVISLAEQRVARIAAQTEGD